MQHTAYSMQHHHNSQGKIVQKQKRKLNKKPTKMDEGEKLYHSSEQIRNQPNNPLDAVLRPKSKYYYYYLVVN